MSEQFLYFLQQMFNGVTLGSTYALIAIGYTMVYGIIGMINFAHGEVYMIGSYVSFMIIAALMMMGIDTGWLLVAAGFVGAIVIASAYGWSIERVAYRPGDGPVSGCPPAGDVAHHIVHCPPESVFLFYVHIVTFWEGKANKKTSPFHKEEVSSA